MGYGSDPDIKKALNSANGKIEVAVAMLSSNSPQQPRYPYYQQPRGIF